MTPRVITLCPGSYNSPITFFSISLSKVQVVLTLVMRHSHARIVIPRWWFAVIVAHANGFSGDVADLHTHGILTLLYVCPAAPCCCQYGSHSTSFGSSPQTNPPPPHPSHKDVDEGFTVWCRMVAKERAFGATAPGQKVGGARGWSK